jgi:uncharacterized protein (TIGR02246 family)
MRTDHDEIRGVLAQYCQLCDDGRFDEWGQLFTDTATFTVLGTTHEGRDAIQAFISAAQPPEARGRHMLSVPLITMTEGAADVATDYTFVARTEQGFAITSAGRYLDHLVRDGGRWRFASREIVFVGE